MTAGIITKTELGQTRWRLRLGLFVFVVGFLSPLLIPLVTASELPTKLSEEAERFYVSGPTFLQRYFPFWAANFLARMKIMLLPLLALLYPLFKIMPPIYRWRMRSRIYRWYSELDAVDPDTYKADIASHLDEDMAELDRIEKNVSNISVPRAYAEELFHLRLHIEMLRNKLRKMRNI